MKEFKNNTFAACSIVNQIYTYLSQQDTFIYLPQQDTFICLPQ